ncbi:MAG: methyltransferase domain-containing protein [Alphaproteobacteria bacterium]|nr:methyltransferase domain-containing protein [Alphaproteobacteria bacterium]
MAGVNKLHEIWGKRLHCGIYPEGSETIEQATAAMDRSLLAAADIKPGMRVLEVGCGYGDLSLDIWRAGATVHGVDIEDRMPHSDEGITFEKGDFHALDFADASLDVVIAHECLTRSRDVISALREMRRVLRPGGRLVISHLFVENDKDRAKMLKETGMFCPSSSEWQAMCRSARFRIDAIWKNSEQPARFYADLAEKIKGGFDLEDKDERREANRLADYVRLRVPMAKAGQLGKITLICR